MLAGNLLPMLTAPPPSGVNDGLWAVRERKRGCGEGRSMMLNFCELSKWRDWRGVRTGGGRASWGRAEDELDRE